MTEHHEEYCKSGEHHQCCDKMHKKSHEEHCCHSDKLLEFAGEAWKELLKEKIKANIEKEHGPHLDKLADMLAKANGDRWKHKIEAKMCYEEYQNTLKDFFKSNK